ncbi:hypothetical protein Ddye_016442 [Dipteronia dyeriana]|uniref:RNase H type-1 domain-containing protein n=1 Tax=Dipteronia dyeriana TaxID=168575 RepID=A0AAD9U7I5_9ROSI|nr:hypothetical protein Ddye_016442 [Dipteronia dyeriana]
MIITLSCGERHLDVPKKWQPPNENLYKLKLDVAINERNRRVGVGWLVVCNHLGWLMASSAQRVNAWYYSQVVEAVTVLRVVKFAMDSRLLPIVLESNALGVINMINTGSHCLANIGLIVGDNIEWFHNSTGCSIVMCLERRMLSLIPYQR